jgi:hypothetical protein
MYQWPYSKVKIHGCYQALKNHREIAQCLKRAYDSNEDVSSVRYVSSDDVTGTVLMAKIHGFDERNFREKLPLFSLVQILYRYLRCDAVHNARFPLVDQVYEVNGNIRYESNHAITGDRLLETVEGVLKAMRQECVRNAKWPHELEQPRRNRSL